MDISSLNPSTGKISIHKYLLRNVLEYVFSQGIFLLMIAA